MLSLEMFVIFLFITFIPLHGSLGVTINAVMPRNITALSGSCVQIPCTFNTSDFEVKLRITERIFGCWLKTTHNFSGLVFNGSGPIIKGFSHIEMVGNLSLRECTTVFYNVINNHSDVYYFRVQMEPQIFRFTFFNYSINIKVLDVPKPPELNDLQEVMEGTAVNLICSAEAPCPKQPPTLSWTYIPKSANIITQLREKPDKTHSVFSTMTFKASYMDNRMSISCTATYPRNISNNTAVKSTVMLQVLFPPKETRIIIEPSALVSFGTNVTLTCKSKANPSNDLNYTWYKRGELNLWASGEQIAINVSKTNGGWYFCRAENKHGGQNSKEVLLNVEGPLESSVLLIAGLVGAFLALLLLFLLVTLYRRVQRAKASNEPTVGETGVSDQGREQNVQTDYVNGDFIKSVICQRMRRT